MSSQQPNWHANSVPDGLVGMGQRGQEGVHNPLQHRHAPPLLLVNEGRAQEQSAAQRKGKLKIKFWSINKKKKKLVDY